MVRITSVTVSLALELRLVFGWRLSAWLCILQVLISKMSALVNFLSNITSHQKSEYAICFSNKCLFSLLFFSSSWHKVSEDGAYELMDSFVCEGMSRQQRPLIFSYPFPKVAYNPSVFEVGSSQTPFLFLSLSLPCRLSGAECGSWPRG